MTQSMAVAIYMVGLALHVGFFVRTVIAAAEQYVRLTHKFVLVLVAAWLLWPCFLVWAIGYGTYAVYASLLGKGPMR